MEMKGDNYIKKIYKDDLITLIQGDCLDVMDKMIEKGIKVDAIITDIPYGTTGCKWDSIIPFEDMWDRLKKISRDKNTPTVLFGSQPFTSALVMSNPKMFKYEWIYQKNRGSNFATLKYQPMKEHENILVFAESTANYNPIKEERKGSGLARVKYEFNPSNTGKRDTYNNMILTDDKTKTKQDDLRFPSSIQKFNTEVGHHPTQKPIPLMEYLIRTYSNEGDLILDFTCGSGSTLLAAKNLNRKCIGIELDENYCKVAESRILKH